MLAFNTLKKNKLIFVTTSSVVGFERKGVAISFPMQQSVTVTPFKITSQSRKY